MEGLWDVGLWAVAFLLQCVQTFLVSYYLITFTDWEEDAGEYNAMDLSRRINTLFKVEYVLHALVTVLLLLGHHFLIFAINLPILIYNLYRVHTAEYKVDPTTLWKTIDRFKKESMARLAGSIILVVLYLWMLVYISATL